MATYGTTEIPSDNITVQSGGTITVSAAFDNTVGLVGGMDTANGTATEGEAVRVESRSDAEEKFGDGSELHNAVELAFINGASTVYAAPASENTTTESFAATTSGTLTNVPIFDPLVNTEHDITATDTVAASEVATSIDYDSPPATPSEGVAVNPVTGEFEAAESSDYDITYDYGDYTSAISGVVSYIPRFVAVMTEGEGVADTLLTEMNNYANDFDFMHGVVGALPEANADTYTHSFDDRRLSVLTSPRGFIDDEQTEMVRTAAAVVGEQASRELGDSTTYDGVSGLTGLNTKYTNTELGTLIDEGFLPLKQSGEIDIVKDMTTSTDAKFERIYASEITDEATELSHQISQQYVGEANTESNRFALGESHSSSYAEMENEDLLDGYAVSVEEGATANEVALDISLDVVNVMDAISVDITVGDIIENGGAS